MKRLLLSCDETPGRLPFRSPWPCRAARHHDRAARQGQGFTFFSERPVGRCRAAQDGFGEACGATSPSAAGSWGSAERAPSRRRRRRGCRDRWRRVTARESAVRVARLFARAEGCRGCKGVANGPASRGMQGGVRNDDPCLGSPRGGASSGPAEGPWRVWEGGAPPARRVSGAGVRGL